MRLLSAFAAAAALSVAGAGAQAAPSDGAQPVHTRGGASFSLPAGWTQHAAADMIVVDAPEADTHVAIIDVPKAADARAAVIAAWALYKGSETHPFRLLTPLPPRNGWDEGAAASYETSPSEHLAVQAIARRKGSLWTVTILDGSESTVEKRSGPIGLLVQSLRPDGYARETFAGRTAHRLDAARIQALLDFVRTSSDALHVPGVGVALIDHGKVVYEGGVGVRQAGKPEPVDAHTRFMIASNTKGMSTLLLARLVDEGKLKWDQPVTEVYPDFRLGSEETTRHVLMKHLVCACTGVPRKDYEWIFNTTVNTPPSTAFKQLAATEPTSKFGELFQYNNLMATAAGYIGAHIVHPDLELGVAYDRAMQEKIFDPLGMKDTTFSTRAALGADHASPHGEDPDGGLHVIRGDINDALSPYRPAGGAWSSPHDMILYVEDELTQGLLPDGRRFISAENLLARRVRGVAIGEDQWYGMGLMEDATYGISVIHHGGDLAGFHSDIIAIPSAGVGAVFLTNSDSGVYMRRPFLRRLLEILYDGRPEAASDVATAAANRQAQRALARKKLSIPPAPADVAGIAGDYVSRDLGPLSVTRAGDTLVFRTNAWSSIVASRRNDDGTTSLITIDPAVPGFDFVAGSANGKHSLTVRDGQHVYVFTERGG